MIVFLDMISARIFVLSILSLLEKVHLSCEQSSAISKEAKQMEGKD